MADQPASGSPLSFWRQLGLFDRVYWIANWMELVERFAYYGVRVICPLFLVAAFDKGGLELTQIQKGSIFAIWAVVQSFVPILSGGLADRYGFKLNLVAATILKIIGYLIMGYSVALARAFTGMSLGEARAAGGTDPGYVAFLAGALFLATGTAIFKPGLQGLISKRMPKDGASLGWGLFYQMVNVGAFIGPLLAGYLRVLKWEYVFIACSVGIALNFIPLFLFREPERDPNAQKSRFFHVLAEAFRGLLDPRLFFFTLCFAGYWALNMQFFDLLPNFIDDWVDSRGVAAFLGGIIGEGRVPKVDGNMTQEWMMNFNALLISLFAFLVGYVTGRLRSLVTIFLGITLSAASIFALGLSMNGWLILVVIGCFSLGEMMAAPTNFRYLASIAPEGKDGLYMGYANFTVGIGWSLGSILAGNIYQERGDKVELARKFLVEKQGLAKDMVAAIGKSDLLPFFDKTVGRDAWGTRTLLWETYDPYYVWKVFALIGVFAMAAIWIYNHIVKAADADPGHGLNTNGRFWVRVFLVPICLLLLVASWRHVAAKGVLDSLGLLLNAVFFWAILGFSLLDPKLKRRGS